MISDALLFIKNNQTSTIFLLFSLFIMIFSIYQFSKKNGVSTAFKQIFIWVFIMSLLIVFYAFKSDFNYFTMRVISVLIPSYNWVSDQKIVISRHHDGHFYLNAKTKNNKTITFLVDTGASDVALSKEDAKTLGIDLTKLKYNKKYYTANGISMGATIILPTLKIGNITLSNIKGHVSSGDMSGSLLGMSVIKRFKNFSIDKNLLFISGPFED